VSPGVSAASGLASIPAKAMPAAMMDLRISASPRDLSGHLFNHVTLV
jgi:hypothetical protein